MSSREPNWFYAYAPNVTRVPVRLKARWALSTRGLRHRITAADAAWLNGEVRYAGSWLCGDGGTNITLLPDDSDEGRACKRCLLFDTYGSGPALYRFFDGEDLLYIGSTIDLGRRIYSHSTASAWWTPTLRVEWTAFDSVNAARAAEVRAIFTERPRHNNIHNPAAKFWTAVGAA